MKQWKGGFAANASRLNDRHCDNNIINLLVRLPSPSFPPKVMPRIIVRAAVYISLRLHLKTRWNDRICVLLSRNKEFLKLMKAIGRGALWGMGH
jgi:hypothetical protein